MQVKILMVDDAENTLELVSRILANYAVTCVTSVNKGIEFLKKEHYDLVITDMKMPGKSGLEMIKYVHTHYEDTAVMMLTGFPSIEGAINAVKLGAEEYLAKPFTEKEITETVEKALSKVFLRQRRLAEGGSKNDNFMGIIGKSAGMQKVFKTAQKVSKLKATVLITGESGTGKELLARAIHYYNAGSQSPFVPVNCAAIPAEIMESELFGYVKGAFTGAEENRPGFFQTAQGGTIFLDEISEMSLNMQAKILRSLQDKEIFPVGGRIGIKADLRIIAATNKNLLQLVEKGLFREDLYYRLNVLNVELPSLCDREGDVDLLLEHFLRKYSLEQGKTCPNFSKEAHKALKNYRWPGNVRELENTIQRLVVFSENSEISVNELPPFIKPAAPKEVGYDFGLISLKEMEKQYIGQVLQSTNGNKSRAAKILGIDRKTLRLKLTE